MSSVIDRVIVLARAAVLGAGVASTVLAGAVASAGVAAAQDAPDAERGQTRVVGGKKAVDGAWPSQVKIFAPDPAGRGRFRAHCGGTVVASEWVLTAAHCFVAPAGPGARRQAVFAPDLLVVAGTNRVPAVIAVGDDTVKRAIKVKNVIYHPDFNPGNFGNDIALIQLEKPAGVPVMPLTGDIDRANDLAGLAATVVGWGFTAESQSFDTELLPADLQEVELPVADIAACRAAYTDSALKGNSIDDRNLCAGFKVGGRDACRGDSGGPLMLRAETGGWVQAGVVSWGEGCGRQGRFGVYTRVAAFESWIRQVTGDQIARPLRPSPEWRLSVDAMTQVALGPSTLPQVGDLPAFELTSPADLARSAALVAPGDRALVIGIDGYVDPLTIKGSVADAKAVATLLTDGLGFRRDQVLTLTNEKATRANILAALDTFVVQGSRPGARVFVYYSGQGFQSRVFPALRDSVPGPAIAPADLRLVSASDGTVRDVTGAITATEIRRMLSRLSDRSVTAIFDTTQISRRELQRPARAGADDVGKVRSVEAVVNLSPDIAEIRVRSASEAGLDPGRNAVIWYGAAPDQWALIDERGAEPMGAFTKLWLGGLRATRLVSGRQVETSLADLRDSIGEGAERFCEEAGRLCRLGLNPQLAAPEAALTASVISSARIVGAAARSVPAIQNPAGVALDLAAGRSEKALGTVTTQKPGYLIVVQISPEGRVRQVYPDLDELERMKKPPKDINAVAAGKPFVIPAPAGKAPRPTVGAGIVLAIVADKPVQAIDLPDQPLTANDAYGSLVYIHDYAKGLKVADQKGTLVDVEWSFDAKVDRTESAEK